VSLSWKCAVVNGCHCAFLRRGLVGMSCGLSTATLLVSWRLRHVTELLIFSDSVYMRCTVTSKPVVKLITGLVSCRRFFMSRSSWVMFLKSECVDMRLTCKLSWSFAETFIFSTNCHCCKSTVTCVISTLQSEDLYDLTSYFNWMLVSKSRCKWRNTLTSRFVADEERLRPLGDCPWLGWVLCASVGCC